MVSLESPKPEDHMQRLHNHMSLECHQLSRVHYCICDLLGVLISDSELLHALKKQVEALSW